MKLPQIMKSPSTRRQEGRSTLTGERPVSVNLENINTLWSLVRQAHGETGTDARRMLVMRYSSAIRNFVRVVVRNDDLADELAQDAIVRLLKGDFAGADPNRGRFRDLLKVAIRNMARNYWAKENRRTGVNYDVDLIGTDACESKLDDMWAKSWRENLLRIAWAKLKEFETNQPNSSAYRVLRLRTEFPGASSQELAGRLSEEIGRRVAADTLRQQLRRARVRFAEFLVEEIADGLVQPSADLVQDELINLGLYESVRDTLPEAWRRNASS